MRTSRRSTVFLAAPCRRGPLIASGLALRASQSLRLTQVHSAVRELESGMEQIASSQQFANRGIYILCKVVGEMMRGAGTRFASVVELENYIEHPTEPASERSPIAVSGVGRGIQKVGVFRTFGGLIAV